MDYCYCGVSVTRHGSRWQREEGRETFKELQFTAKPLSSTEAADMPHKSQLGESSAQPQLDREP